jgi:hypothetical protein
MKKRVKEKIRVQIKAIEYIIEDQRDKEVSTEVLPKENLKMVGSVGNMTDLK